MPAVEVLAVEERREARRRFGREEWRGQQVRRDRRETSAWEPHFFFGADFFGSGFDGGGAGSERVDVGGPVRAGTGESVAAGCERHVASAGGQLEEVDAGWIVLPEPGASTAAAAGRHHEPIRMERDAPGRSLERVLRLQELCLPVLPVDEDHRRIADAGEGVGDVGDSRARELRAVG